METNKIKMLTIKEASKLFDGLTEYRIREMCISGQLPSVKAGVKYLINKDVLLRMVYGEEYMQ